jgi:hypothetical protein
VPKLQTILIHYKGIRDIGNTRQQIAGGTIEPIPGTGHGISLGNWGGDSLNGLYFANTLHERLGNCFFIR